MKLSFLSPIMLFCTISSANAQALDCSFFIPALDSWVGSFFFEINETTVITPYHGEQVLESSEMQYQFIGAFDGDEKLTFTVNRYSGLGHVTVTKITGEYVTTYTKLECKPASKMF